MAHHWKGPHDYSTPQADDSGFPDRLREHLPEPTPERLLNTTPDLITELAGKLDFAMSTVIIPHFKAFVADVMQLGLKSNKLAPGADICGILPSWLHATMSESP
jgi:hypothetical protein